MRNLIAVVMVIGGSLMFTTTASAQDCGKARKILKSIQGTVEKVATFSTVPCIDFRILRAFPQS